MATKLRPTLAELSHGHFMQGLENQAKKKQQEQQIREKKFKEIIEHIQQLRLRIKRSFGDRHGRPSPKPFLGLSYASKEDFDQILNDPNIPPQYKVQLRNELEQLERAQAQAQKSADKRPVPGLEHSARKIARPAPKLDKILGDILSFIFDSAGLNVEPHPRLTPAAGPMPQAGLQMNAQLSPAPPSGGMAEVAVVSASSAENSARPEPTAALSANTPRPMPSASASSPRPTPGASAANNELFKSHAFPNSQSTSNLSVSPTPHSNTLSNTPRLNAARG